MVALRVFLHIFPIRAMSVLRKEPFFGTVFAKPASASSDCLFRAVGHMHSPAVSINSLFISYGCHLVRVQFVFHFERVHSSSIALSPPWLEKWMLFVLLTRNFLIEK